MISCDSASSVLDLAAAIARHKHFCSVTKPIRCGNRTSARDRATCSDPVCRISRVLPSTLVSVVISSDGHRNRCAGRTAASHTWRGAPRPRQRRLGAGVGVCAKLRGRRALVQYYVDRHAINFWILRVAAGALEPRLVDEVVRRKALAASPTEQIVEEVVDILQQSWERARSTTARVARTGVSAAGRHDIRRCGGVGVPVDCGAAPLLRGRWCPPRRRWRIRAGSARCRTVLVA